MVESLKCANSLNNKITRYSFRSDPATDSVATEPKRISRPGRDKVLAEARARLAGYIKAQKSLFALGVINLQFQIKTGLTIEEAEHVTAAVKKKIGGNTGPKLA